MPTHLHTKYSFTAISRHLRRKKEIRLVVSFWCDYLNLDVQRPITSPWHTSSALNSDPSSVK